MEILTLILTTGILLIVYFYLKIVNSYKYFAKRNVPFVKPVFLLGSSVKAALFNEHSGESLADMYNQLKGNKIGGFFRYTAPQYILLDPDYINKVFISDFSHFHDRGVKIDEKTNPLDGHLLFLSGQKWRYLRNKLSPIFTSGKLKFMFEEMSKCGDALMDRFANLADGKDLDYKGVLVGFTSGVIGSCAFGLNSESLNDPNSKFREMGNKVFQISLFTKIIAILRRLLPSLVVNLKIQTVRSDVSEFFISLIKQSIEYRKKTGMERKDFVQLLMQLKDQGSVDIKLNEKEEIQSGIADLPETFKIAFDDGLLAAQSFLFFIAGFETTSTTMYFTLYFLSKYQNVQDKVREEVRKIKQKYGVINYDALKDMEYLEKCISETLRLFPPVPNLVRECTKDYTFPNGVKLTKGDIVTFPMYGLHRDPEYFPDPLTYRPERFDSPIKPGTYAPFGDGPRVCIGKRFAIMEIKMAIARLVDNFKFQSSTKTIEPIELSPSSILIASKNKLYIRVQKI